VGGNIQTLPNEEPPWPPSYDPFSTHSANFLFELVADARNAPDSGNPSNKSPAFLSGGSLLIQEPLPVKRA
jgi:hypothetical protein